VSAAPQALWLYVRCGDRLLAASTEHVERALLVGEAAAPRPAAELGLTGVPRACLGILDVGGAAHAAWDLGLLLGMAPARRAWVLVRLPGMEGPTALALRTDECVHVGPPRIDTLALPLGALRAHGAVRAAFATAGDHALQTGSAPVGYWVDLDALWSGNERHLSRELLQRAGASDARGEHA
jgi:hypothetical protein